MRNIYRYTIGGVLACISPLCLPSASSAQTVVYDNTTTVTGIVQFNGATNFGGNTMTSMNADDLTLAPGSGGSLITSFLYQSFYNAASGTITARPSFYFWAADGVAGNPGTYLAGFTLAPTTFTAQQVTSLSLDIAGFIIPANGRLWAGIVYDDNFGATGVTPGQLNFLGGPLYGPPTIGSSQDGAVFSTQGSYAGVSNPAVTSFNFGGNPPTNFGWRLEAVTVPEAGTFALALPVLGMVGAVVIASRRKRK